MVDKEHEERHRRGSDLADALLVFIPEHLRERQTDARVPLLGLGMTVVNYLGQIKDKRRRDAMALRLVNSILENAKVSARVIGSN